MIALLINDFTSIEFQFGKTFRPKAKPNHVIIPTNRSSTTDIYIFFSAWSNDEKNACNTGDNYFNT